MKWLFRSSSLVIVSAALAVGAVVLVLWPAWDTANRAVARPLARGEQEIVWLNPATSASAWERFVSAVHRVESDYPELHLQVEDADAFPRQTTAVPQLAVTLPQ